jgi:hypothetical protein
VIGKDKIDQPGRSLLRSSSVILPVRRSYRDGKVALSAVASSGTPIDYVAWRDVFHCCVPVYCAIT